MATLKKTNFDATTRITLPVGNTAARPGSPTNGAFRFNSQTNIAELYNNGWNGTLKIRTLGGEVLSRADGVIEHWFHSNGTFVVQSGTQDVEVLCIGGGGGGSGGGPNSGSPGGSGGGLVYGAVNAVPGSYTVTVGGGGARGFDSGANGDPGGAGGNTQVTINGVTFRATGGPGGPGGTSDTVKPGVAGGTGTINGGTSYSYGGVSSVFGTGGTGGTGANNSSNAGNGGSGTNGAPPGGGGSSNNGTAGNGGTASLNPTYGYGGGGGGGGRDGDGRSLTMSVAGSGLYNGGRGGNPSTSAIDGIGRTGPTGGGARGQDGGSRRNAGGGAGLYGAGGGAAGDSSNSNSASGGEGSDGVCVIRYKPAVEYDLSQDVVFYIDPGHEYCYNFSKGGTIRDLANNVNATPNGNISTNWSAGSWYFDGSGDWIRADGVATGGYFESSNPWTVSCWALPTLDGYSGGFGGRVLWSTHDGSGGNRHIFYILPNDGRIGKSNDGTITSNNAAGKLGGEWKLVTVANSGSAYRIYINGVDVGGGSNQHTGQNQFSIGQEYDGGTPGDFYLGWQGFYIIHSRQFTAGEANYLYQLTRGRYGV